MTTGRINQVTTFHPNTLPLSMSEPVFIPNTCHQPSLVTFLVRSSSLIQRAIPTTTSEMHSSWSKTDQPTKQPKAGLSDHPSPPISHISGTFHFVAITMQQIVMTFTGNYQAPSLLQKFVLAGQGGFPNHLSASGLGHRQVVHIPSSMQAFYYLTFHLSHSTLKSSDPPQTSLACQTGLSMARSRIT